MKTTYKGYVIATRPDESGRLKHLVNDDEHFSFDSILAAMNYIDTLERNK